MIARPAPAARAALEQATRRWPNRSRVSDGIVADQAHRLRVSDHNPDRQGYCCAFDLTNDPAHGCDAHALAEELRRRRDSRVKYLISRRRITGPPRWAWSHYDGPNPHESHIHVSITQEQKMSTAQWWPCSPEEEDEVALVDVLVDPEVDGGAWALLEDGTVRPFRGARTLGEPKGKEYWGPRRAKQFEPNDRDGYDVLATSGERYSYPEGGS